MPSLGMKDRRESLLLEFEAMKTEDWSKSKRCEADSLVCCFDCAELYSCMKRWRKAKRKEVIK